MAISLEDSQFFHQNFHAPFKNKADCLTVRNELRECSFQRSLRELTHHWLAWAIHRSPYIDELVASVTQNYASCFGDVTHCKNSFSLFEGQIITFEAHQLDAIREHPNTWKKFTSHGKRRNWSISQRVLRSQNAIKDFIPPTRHHRIHERDSCSTWEERRMSLHLIIRTSLISSQVMVATTLAHSNRRVIREVEQGWVGLPLGF